MTDGDKTFWCDVVCNSGGLGGIFPPLGLHFVRILKQIFGYTAILYTVDRLTPVF
jgi:hypothetical protein